uniref:Uncharacterized protein n=1 Tax=Denticeps clupeoides TaxID=299321 RepID=A0AAY4CQB6_9TELE
CPATRLEESRHCSSPGQYHPYSEACWWQHHAVGCFSAAGTGRLVSLEGKLTAALYRDILDKTCSRALLISDWGDVSSFNEPLRTLVSFRQLHRSKPPLFNRVGQRRNRTEGGESVLHQDY